MKSTLFRCSRLDPACQVDGCTGHGLHGRRAARSKTCLAWSEAVEGDRGAVGAALLCFVDAGGAASVTAADREIDESRLVPALAPGWGEWRCHLRATGPVCSGERHQRLGWAAADLPCDVPLYSRYTSDRYQTRYYDHDYRNYFRKFRTTDLDEMSTSPEGPVTATIRGQVAVRRDVRRPRR